jgi:hypothetical protein
VLDTISTDDIVEELKRRIAKMDEAKTTLAALTGQSMAAHRAKNPNVSKAKEAYWRKRREWLAANPGKTVEDFYREKRRVLTFDTSVHNRLVKIGASANPIYAAIKSQYFFRLAGLSVEEMISTPQAADRRRAAGRVQAAHGGGGAFVGLPQSSIRSTENPYRRTRQRPCKLQVACR